MHKARLHSFIYHSRLHLVITILLIILPFAFFLLFAEATAISSAKLFEDIGVSLMRMIIAYVIALVFAWIFAILFYQGKRAAIALPIFDVLQSFPTFAALPLAAMALGHSHATVIFFLVITIIWPIFFSIISSLRLIKHDWQEAVEIAQLSGSSYLTLFLFPVTIPGIMIGSVIGLGEAWEALIATEIIIGADKGLGSFFNAFSYNPRITAFGILGVLLLIFSINKLLMAPLLEWSHKRMGE